MLRERLVPGRRSTQHVDPADSTALASLAVLEFIKTVDPSHFEAMCRAVHVDGGLVGHVAPEDREEAGVGLR